MKKLLAASTILFILIPLILPGCIAKTPEPPGLISETAVLMDADTGQVLFEKNMNKKEYPASITKIVTAILAIEHGNLNDIITMSDNAVYSVGRDASHISLAPGEQITVEQALYAALLMSANDAANGLAEHVSGSMEAFAKLMTEKAREFGALNTNFNNANGLKDELHYTTAYDMAMITKHALQNPTFCMIFGAHTYKMPPNNKQSEPRPFANQHSMIVNTKFHYDGIIGGKAGYTTVAKFTLVTAAERNGRKLIAVVMKSPKVNDKYTDTIKLLDYGFDNFKKITVTDSEVKKAAGLEQLTLPQDEISLQVLKDINKNDLSFSLIKPTGTKDDTAKIHVTLSKSAAGMYSDLGTYPCSIDSVVETSNSADLGDSEAETVSNTQGWGHVVIVVLKYIAITIGILILLLAIVILILYIRKRIYLAKKRRRRSRRR